MYVGLDAKPIRKCESMDGVYFHAYWAIGTDATAQHGWSLLSGAATAAARTAANRES